MTFSAISKNAASAISKNTADAFNATEPQVIVIGAGLAGLFTALKLAPLPVTVVTAAPVGEGTSSGWAQGGISAALDEGDSTQAHAEDTILAGAGLVDEKIASLLASEAADRIHDLLSYGVPFDKDEANRLRLSREAAHSARRIVRVTGDSAGKAIMGALIKAARAAPSIRFLEHYKLAELSQSNGRVAGVAVVPSASQGPLDEAIYLPARAVVLAAGGIGGLYAVTTNPSLANGEILALAARAGAVISDPEFVQFHPTAINVGLDPAPLATEALRGEGAILVNGRPERFMSTVHADAELAPRDIVARAVHHEVMCGRGAFLDCREAIGAKFPSLFPTVYEKCQAAGIDPANELIPVAPAAHYHMGGVHTDAYGRTTLDGLWACGEVAATGAHGANRLASNSLLEAVVFAARSAEDILGQPAFVSSKDPHFGVQKALKGKARKAAQAAVHRAQNPVDITHLVQQIRGTMSEHVGVVRQEKGLSYALRVFEKIREAYGDIPQLRNMSDAAVLISFAALRREESRGGHFRRDFPNAVAAFQRRTYLSAEDVAERQIRAMIGPPRSKPHLELVVNS